MHRFFIALIDDFKRFFIENGYHLWIEFLQCITKYLTKVITCDIYIYSLNI